MSLAQFLLSPQSIAIVGASDDLTKTASRPLRFLRQAGYDGTLYPIARREAVQGEKAWPSLADLPNRPDHAFVLLPTDGAIEAVAECVRLGVPAVTVLASGFSEAGPDGAERERRLRGLVNGTGTRLLGPSSLGLVNVHRNLVLTANAAFAEPELPKGGLFVASQSGSIIGALVSRGKARGIGFAGLVSVGGEADLTIGEICAATVDDDAITAYLLFLETIRDADKIRAFAVAAAARGKPVIAYKLGRSTAAAELAMSHTGALAGEDDVADAFLRDCGIARAASFETLLEAPALLQRLPIRSRGLRAPRVAVVTTTGGGAAMVVDQLGIREVEVTAPSPETVAKLATQGIDAGHGRIVDLTLAGTRPEVMSAAIGTLLAASEYDMLVAVVGSSARFQPDLAVRPIVDCAGTAAHLAAFLVPEAPDALAMLTKSGVPAFRTPEACADAIAAAFRRLPPRALEAAKQLAADDGEVLDELESYQLLQRVGVPHAACQKVNVDEVAGATLPFSYPVAVKVLSADLPHKSDVGGVRLGIADAIGLAAAARQIVDSVAAHRPDIPVSRLLVQQMRRGVGEVLIGFRRDKMVGPVVLLAAGGTLAEIYRDRAVRMAPVSEADAWDMIGSVRALQALAGYRDKPRGDLEALARAIVSISRMGELSPSIAEFEANPVLVHERGAGVEAVDALARLA